MVFSIENPLWSRAGAAVPLTETPSGRPLTLVFADDFQSVQPCAGSDGVWHAGFEASAGPRELVDVAAAVAAVSAPPSGSPADYPYVSGLITTQPSFAQTYGYFEMRAKLPRGKGLWPAFWMLPQDQSWPPEIDVVESVGDPSRVYMTAYSKFFKAESIEAQITRKAFHVFAVSWDSQQISWFIDGAETGRVATPPDMHKPMYLLVNLAVGGTWRDAPEETTPLPAKMMIDYIRAYRFSHE